jgi:hypothetical protein
MTVNKNLPILIPALIAIGVGLAVSGVFNTSKPAAPSSLTVTPRVFEGGALFPMQAQTVRLAAIAGGVVVADSAVVNNKYKLELPAKIPDGVAFTLLENISLLHGEGHLKAVDGVKASDVKLIFYQDLNKSAKYDTGEPQLEGTFFKAGANLELQGYFQYKLILLNGAAALQESQDTATGTKGYYKYDLKLEPGWALIQSELTGSFEITEVKGEKWDVVMPLAKGGKGSPPTFTP